MKRLPIELLDKEGGKEVIYLQTPSYFGLQMVDELRQERADARAVEVTDVPTSLDLLLAALLTDMEPLGATGYPEHYWTPPEVAKRIPMEVGAVDRLWEIVQVLLEDAAPKAEGAGDGDDAGDPPTKAGDGKTKPSSPAKSSNG